MPQSVRLSVSLSVRLSQTVCNVQVPLSNRWNTWTIISRPNSLKYLFTSIPTSATWCNGNTPKLGWNRGGSGAQKPAISLKRCKIGPRLLWRITRKSHTRFRLAPKSVTLDDLERMKQMKRHSCRNKKYGAHQKIQRRSILSAAKWKPMILVCHAFVGILITQLSSY